MIVKLLSEHHLEFLSFKGGCRGSSESTLVKMSNCLKSRVVAQLFSHLSQCHDAQIAVAQLVERLRLRWTIVNVLCP